MRALAVVPTRATRIGTSQKKHFLQHTETVAFSLLITLDSLKALFALINVPHTSYLINVQEDFCSKKQTRIDGSFGSQPGLLGSALLSAYPQNA